MYLRSWRGSDNDLTAAQQGWLDCIRTHLVANVSTDRADSETLPVFADHGGWTKWDRDFGGNLIRFLREVNEAIAEW
jgi:type I restriction enzyme R subunit